MPACGVGREARDELSWRQALYRLFAFPSTRGLDLPQPGAPAWA